MNKLLKAFWVLAALYFAAVAYGRWHHLLPWGKTPAAPTHVVVLKDDAPAWCLDPDEPHGDQWFETCAEPLR